MSNVMLGVCLPPWPYALSTTQDNHAKKGEHSITPRAATPRSGAKPSALACNCEGLFHTLHNARPNQMTQGVGQGIY